MKNRLTFSSDEQRVLCEDTLRTFFAYDPDTGRIYFKRVWARPGRTYKIGDLGTRPLEGLYLIMRPNFLGKKLSAHHAAWFLYYGTWPTSLVDHRNTNLQDNSIDNLRLASQSENIRNASKLKASNKSGFHGVYWHTRSQKWVAKIRANNKVRHLGSFKDREAAARAYDAGALLLHGEFRFLNFPEHVARAA